MKIKVIFTGGTIGSRTEDGFIGLSGVPYVLINRFCEYNKDSGVEFEAAEPYSILSEELTSTELSRLADCVREQLDGADALIITHGTDTLVYTAAFLGFLFSDVRIPIILVSSGYPLDDRRANGYENFAAAVSFAKHGIGGVYAVWTAEGVSVIHSGIRTLIQQPYSDMLQSVGGMHFGICEKDSFLRNADFTGLEKTDFFADIEPDIEAGFGRVMRLTCCPQMYYPEPENCQAVLLSAYHSGTMCADSRLEKFMESAQKRNIPVFLTGAGGRSADYETVKKYRSLGIIPLPVMSPEAAYIKLSLALSCKCNTEKVMTENCAGEITEI